MKTSVVITTINKPNKIIKRISRHCKTKKWDLIIIGDKKSPKNFKMNFGRFLSLNHQSNLNLKFAKICPQNSYARKNIGYLVAMKENKIIIETDDDNFPKKSFFQNRKITHKVNFLKNENWINIYDFFLKKNEFIWPRGLPLDEFNNKIKISNNRVYRKFFIQQNVCDKNPDVDSIYRIINEKINIKFKNKKISLKKSLSTFNSQNTTWFRDVFLLMYLPVTCTMRCTDIWRSIIALKLMSINNFEILFGGPTVIQYRNEHNLLKDFVDEIPMLENDKIIYNTINNLKLKKGNKNFSYNMKLVYKKLISKKILDKKEMVYLNAWIEDCKYLLNKE